MITHALSRQNSLAPPLRPVVHTTRRGRDGPAVSRRFCCREMFRRRFMGGKRPDAAGCVEKLQFLCAARGVIVTAMPKASLAAMVKHCDQLLRTKSIGDYDGAANGLQVENSGTGHTNRRHRGRQPRHGQTRHRRQGGFAHRPSRTVLVAVASVDGQKTRTAPAAGGKQSGHLQFAPAARRASQARQQRATLRRARPEKSEAVFPDPRPDHRLQIANKISRAELAKRLERATGAKPKIIPGGKTICERIGVVTGGAGGDLKIAADEGVDTFITGEGPHWTFALAEELGLNVLYGGHYATETFGVKALAAHLSGKFKLPWEFLDHPTGL